MAYVVQYMVHFLYVAQAKEVQIKRVNGLCCTVQNTLFYVVQVKIVQIKLVYGLRCKVHGKLFVCGTSQRSTDQTSLWPML